MTVRVTVIDYGAGNIGSICKMIRYVGGEPIVASRAEQLVGAERLILPGVGHFDRAVENLKTAGLVEALTELVQIRNVPILGICLGMQLMCRTSEEGSSQGLGFLNAHCRRFEFSGDRQLKVPHMGWKSLNIERPTGILGGLDTDARFYFVHSYYVECADSSDIAARADHGHTFVAAFERGNVSGVQFHPEKSHRFGIQLFENYLGIQS